MTDSDAAPTAFTPPASDPVVNTSTAAFSPPESDPVITPQSSQTPTFTPPDEDAAAAEVIGKVNSSTAKQLADDHTFNPAAVVSQYHTALSSEQVDKLAEAYHNQRAQHMTAGDLGRAASKTPSALKDFVVGAFQLAKRIPSVIGKAGRSVALVPEAMEATSAENMLAQDKEKPFLTPEDRGRYQDTIDSYNNLKAGFDQASQAPDVQKQSKESAEVFAGLESGTVSAANLVHHLGRNVAGYLDRAEGVEPKATAEDKRNRLFEDAGNISQSKLIGQGQGAVAETLGQDAKTLSAQGITLDPDVIEKMSSVESPVTWVPMLAGAKIAALGNGFQVVNNAGTVIAKTATRKAAEAAVKWSGEKIAQAGTALGESGTGLAKLAGLGHAMHGGGLTGIATAAAVKAGAAVSGKIVSVTGKALSNPAVYSPLLDFAAGTAKGAAGGAAVGVPFAMASDTPQEAADALVTSAGFGAVGGAAHVAGAKVKQASLNAIQHVVAAHFDTATTLQPVNDYTLPNASPELEAQHSDAMDALKQNNPFAANLLNRYRAAMGVKGVPSYLLTSEQAAALNPDLAGKDGAYKVQVPTATGPKPGIIWVSGEKGPKALGHEVGHFFDDFILTPEERAQLDEVTAGKFQEGFNQHYLSSEGLTEAQRKTLSDNPDKLKAELRAEILSGVLDSANFGDVPQTIQAKALGVTSRVLERLGMYQPGVAEGVEAPNVTGFGTKLSPRGHAIATDVVNRWIQDPGVQSAIKDLSNPSTSSTPKPANTPGEAIDTSQPLNPEVTPAHEKVLELLKPKVSTDEFNSWTAIKDKIQKGESITPEESQDWGKLDEVAQSMPPEIEAAPTTAPAAPKAEEITPVEPEPAAKPAAPVEPGELTAVPDEKATISKEIPNLRVTRKQQNAFENTPERTDIGIQEAAAAVEKGTPEQKKVFQTLREALRAPQGQVKPVEIVHGSVEPVEETPGGTRTKRRTEQEDQGQRGQYQKLIIPDGFNVTKTGKVQLRAISPDKVLSNARQIVSNKKAEALVPYEVKDGQFTDKSAQEFNDDLEQYWVNQAAGFKGDGTPLTRPENHGGFIPSENNAGQVKPIAKDKADFLNLVQGIAPPKTARVNLDKLGNKIKPVNVRAFELAKANSKEPMKPGVISNKDINKQTYEDYGNQQVSEFNPLRKSLDEAGVPTRELLEATERLNLEDIKQAVSRPDNRLRAPVTDVTAAGFLPSREPVAEQAAEKLGLKFGGNLRGLWQFDVTDPKDGQPIRFAIKEGATEEQIKAKADAKLSEFAEGNGTRELNPDWRVSIHREPSIPNFPGYVQIDDISGGVNKWSKSPQTLRAEGYDIPDSLFEKVSTGRYKLGDLLEGKSEPLPQVQMRDLREKTQFQPVTTKTEKQAKGNDEVRSIAADYVREAGLPYAPHSGNQEINEPLAKRIASFYGSAKHEPTDPEVKSAYAAFVQETKDQYRHLTSEGYVMQPWTKEGQPYKNSAEMSADVRDNKHLWYFPTEGGFGTGEAKAVHPLLDDSGVKVGNKTVPVNDLFRAVHDVFGHSAEGYEFGPRGELNAFKAHAAMYSEEARPAMAAETLGQNSWVNFGEHLRDESGNIAKKGEKGFVPLTDRPFAEQKATTLPKGMVDAVMNPEEGIQFQPKPDEEKSLFHGTPVKWEKPRLGRPGVFWLTEDPKTAKEGYARGGEVKEFKTQLGNVADLTKDRSLYKKLVEIYNKDSEIKGDPDRTHRLSDADEASVINSADVLSYLKKQGYDSARVFEDRSSGETSYAVFDTKQLNRATPEFLPSKEPRAVKSAAIRDEDGNIFEGPMHVFAHMEAARANNEGPFEEGFVANNGEFLSREQAYRRGRDLGQIESGVGNPPDMPDEATRDAHHEDFQHLATEADSRKNSEFGQQFKPKRKDLKLTHFSPQENLKELDPEFHGTGLLGAERKRAANYPKLYPKRSYFGLPGYEKEQGLGNNRYSASVPKDSVYDFQADPDNLYPSSAEIEKAGYAPMDNGAKTTLYEKRIKEAGYKGYLNKAAKAVAMFDKTPVESEGQQFMPSRKQENLVPIDGLHPETRGDIIDWLHENIPALQTLDRSDVKESLFGLVDPPLLKRETVPVSSIKVHPDRQTNEVAVKKYASLVSEAPAVLLNGNKLLEGGHRVASYKLAGKKVISAVDIAPLINMDWESWLRGETPDNAPSASILRPGESFLPARAGLSINASDIQAKRAETAWKEDGTDSPFFKRWFGDSVIADKKGEPKLVYHGTSVPKDFDVFKAKEIGFHFGTKEQANEILERHEYQSGDSENQRVIPVYLRVENPLRVEDEGSWTAQRVQYALRGLDGFSNEEVKSATTLEKLRALIESKGYDGLVYKNAGEVKGLTELQKKLDAGKASQAEFEKLQATGDDSYIVWHPEQVKSAFNRGTFDNEALAMQFLPVTKTASSKSVPNEDIQPATKTGTLGASKKEDFQSVEK